MNTRTAGRPSSQVQRLEGDNVMRFDIHQRIQHILMFTSFIILAVTGLPLKFGSAVISQWWIALWGGIENTRTVHHIAGIVMAADGVYHVVYILVSVAWLKRAFPFEMIPNLNDVRDFIQDLKYTFGMSKEKTSFDRFSYREKFDYFAVFWGMALMVGGGFILLFPVQASRLLPPWIVPAALVAHSDEAMLAIGWIMVVHMFFVHLSPGIFPMNKSIFTGRMPRKKYAEEHPVEYNRLVSKAAPAVEALPAEDGQGGQQQK